MGGEPGDEAILNPGLKISALGCCCIVQAESTDSLTSTMSLLFKELARIQHEYLNIVGFTEEVPAEGVEGIHGFLHEVAPQAPHEGEDEHRADERVEFGGVHAQVDLGLLATEEGVHEGAEHHDPVDFHLVVARNALVGLC